MEIEQEFSKCVVCAKYFSTHLDSYEKCKENIDECRKMDKIFQKMFHIFCQHILNRRTKFLNSKRKKSGNNFQMNIKKFPFCSLCRDEVALLCSLQNQVELIEKNIFKTVARIAFKILDSFHKLPTTDITNFQPPYQQQENLKAVESLRRKIVKIWSPVPTLEKLDKSVVANYSKFEQNSGSKSLAGIPINLRSSEPAFESAGQSQNLFENENSLLPASPSSAVSNSNPNPNPTCDELDFVKQEPESPYPEDHQLDPEVESVADSNEDSSMENQEARWSDCTKLKLDPEDPDARPKLNKVVCPICKMKLMKQNTLKRHMAIHHRWTTNSNLIVKSEVNVNFADQHAQVVEYSEGKFAFGFRNVPKALLYEQKPKPASSNDIESTEGFHCSICRFLAPSHSHMILHFRQRHSLNVKSPIQTLSTCIRKMAIVRSIAGQLLYDGKWGFEKLEADKGMSGKIKCLSCNLVVAHMKQFRGHVARKHALEKFVCDDCGKTFEKREYFQIHKRRHDKTRVKKKVLCDICGQACSSRKAYSAHKSRIHPPNGLVNHKKHVCSQCGKKCFSLPELKRHLTTHQDEKNFQCPDCHKKFKQKMSLRRHQKASHEGVKAYSCPHCDRRFTQPQSKKRHLENVHREGATANKTADKTIVSKDGKQPSGRRRRKKEEQEEENETDGEGAEEFKTGCSDQNSNSSTQEDQQVN